MVFLVHLFQRDFFINQLLHQSGITDGKDGLGVGTAFIVNILGKLHDFSGIHSVVHPVMRTHANRKVTIIVDGNLALISLFGGYHNHTVGSLRTIDGCSRSVFQDSDAFNVIRIEP